MNQIGMDFWRAQARLWKAQAELCALRRDIYRMAARNCELPLLGIRPLQGAAVYCQMQAGSCEMQEHFCRMLASLLS